MSSDIVKHGALSLVRAPGLLVLLCVAAIQLAWTWTVIRVQGWNAYLMLMQETLVFARTVAQKTQQAANARCGHVPYLLSKPC